LIPLVWTTFSGIKLGPIVLKVLFKPVEQFGKSRLGFGGADPRVLFIMRSPGHTGLTGAAHRSDRCNPVGFLLG
jgi:hypothetical protein